MDKVKMSSDIILDQRIVVYTEFIDHNIFEVMIKKGVDTSPTGPIWQRYIEYGFDSKNEVVTEAFKKTKKLLEKGKEL